MADQDKPEFLGPLDYQGDPQIVAMGWFGVILFWLGMALLVGSWFYDPSVETTGTYALAERIVNMGRMQTQMMLFLSGCFIMVAGAIFWVGGALFGIARDAANRQIADAQNAKVTSEQA